MKTIEEKAKAYDEAIEQAQKELATCGSMDCDAARQIFRFFPELKESEDDKIIQFLINWINDNGIGTLHYIDISWKEKILDWLEKQKEQKPAEWSEENERKMDMVTDALHSYWSYNKFTMLVSWLKSLRPYWKPSDKPVWRIWKNGACGNSEGNPIALVKTYGGYKLVSCLGADGEKYIMLSDLEKLPGFNEK